MKTLKMIHLKNSCIVNIKQMSRVILISALLFSTQHIYAQVNISEQAKRLTAAAIDKNYELNNSLLEADKTEQDIKSAKATYIPKVSAMGAYAYLKQDLEANISILPAGIPIPALALLEGDKSFGVKGQVGLAAVNAEMVLFSGMQAEYGAKALKEKKNAQQYMSQAQKNTITQDILETIDQIALLHQSKLLLDESQKRLNTENLRVTKAINNGLAIPYDRKRIEVAVYRLEAKKQEYEGKKELLFSKLSMLTGLSTQEIQNQTAGIVNLNPWKFPTSMNIEDEAQNRSEIQALNSGSKAIDYQIKMQKAKFLPQVIALGSVSYSNIFNSEISTPIQLPGLPGNIGLQANKMEGFPNYIFGVGAKWQIFSGTQRSHELKKLNIEKDIIENRKKDVSEKLNLLLKKGKIEFRLAEKQMQLKSSEKTLSEQALDHAVKSYQQGLISISERIEAEVSFQQVQTEYVQTVFEQRKAALSFISAQGNLDLDSL